MLQIDWKDMNNDSITDAISKKFLCPQKFAQEIENIVKVSNLNYIDAIIHYCEENNMEVESVSKLISKPLKEKIKYDAIQLNFLKKTSKAKIVF